MSTSYDNGGKHKNSLNVKKSTDKGKFLNSKKPNQTHQDHSIEALRESLDNSSNIQINKWN